MNSFSPRKIAMLAYIPFVGFLIAFSINRDDKYPFATWHIKNMFGLFVLFVASLVIQSRIDLLTGDILFGVALILWIYSFIMAVQNKEKGFPILAERFQQWFTFLN